MYIAYIHYNFDIIKLMGQTQILRVWKLYNLGTLLKEMSATAIRQEKELKGI